MEGFTVALALLDFVPVAAFGIAGLLAGIGMASPLFIVGGALSFAAGLLKAAWKLILGIWRKNIPWMDKSFLPLQISGFFIMVVAGIIQLFRRGIAALSAIYLMPQGIFFLCWLLLAFLMVIYKKTRFEHDDAKSNYAAEIINSLCQISLLIGVLLSMHA